jgi:phenylpropionate dioxygenase-like ring-hydroxylating dioxygenase large terminal subunit
VQGILRSYWYPVARSADIRDKPVAITLLDQPVVLFRAGEEITALRDLCIHRGAPLSLGWLDDGGIVCAYHGWAYGPQGECVRIPSLPEGKTIPRKARAQRYQVEQRYGLVWVCLEGEPAQPVPPYPPYDDTGRATVLYDAFRWKANAARVCENVLDYWMLFTCAPTSARETVQWFFTSRDWDRHHPDHDWEVFDAIVMEQDRRIVENQRPEELPLDLSEELHLRGSDAGTLAYRRFLRELGVAWHH